MRAGELRTRLTFQTNTPTANSMGELVDTWADTLTVWGAVRPLTGGRLFQAQQANSEVRGEVEVRYSSSITASMRMVVGTRVLTILSIANPDSRNERLLIQYKEGLD